MFDSFANLIYGVGQRLTVEFITKALKGATLGLGTYAGLQTIFDKMIQDATSILYQGNSMALQILGLAGVDVALSVILSACAVRVFIQSNQIFLTKL